MMRFLQEHLEILDRSVHWVNVEIIGDVIAVVLERRREKGQQPEAGDSQILQVVQLLNQTLKIADAVAVAVLEGTDVEFVDERAPLYHKGSAALPRCFAIEPSWCAASLWLKDDNGQGRKRHC